MAVRPRDAVSVSVVSDWLLLRLFAVLVFAHLTFDEEEYQQDDGTYEGQQHHEHPPSAAAAVVQTTYAHGERRDNGGEHVEKADKTGDAVAGDQSGDAFAQITNQTGGHDYDEADQEVEQDEVPVLRAARAATESGVLAKYAFDRCAKVHSDDSDFSECIIFSDRKGTGFHGRGQGLGRFSFRGARKKPDGNLPAVADGCRQVRDGQYAVAGRLGG